MFLKKLGIHGLRNLSHNEVYLSPTSNFFCGVNGSGKTSLLEAIHVLGRGRSFRSRTLEPIINEEEQACTVYGVVQAERSSVSLGVTRSRAKEFEFKMNGQKVNSASLLADTMPLLVLSADTFRLLDAGPQYRRQYIDWGVFHVERAYRSLLQKFKRALKQRNSLLRCDRIDMSSLSVWDIEFVELADQINQYRKQYLEKLIEKIQWVIGEITELDGFEFKYFPGWDAAKNLSDVLYADRQRDVQMKATTHGPQRADLRVRFNMRPANEVLSRGQTKIVVTAMQVAQGYLYHEMTGQQCLYLLDDLPSELDLSHRKRVGGLLFRLGAQTFVTGVIKEDLMSSWPIEDENVSMFHVEHGHIIQE